jgi:hypothetical protein
MTLEEWKKEIEDQAKYGTFEHYAETLIGCLADCGSIPFTTRRDGYLNDAVWAQMVHATREKHDRLALRVFFREIAYGASMEVHLRRIEEAAQNIAAALVTAGQEEN